MKELFVDKKFGAEAEVLLAHIEEVLVRYADQGYDLSLRQLYYQLVAANIVPNSERSYKNIGNLVSDARLAGRIDWDMIADRARTVSSNPHWENPRDFIDVVAPQFATDKWLDQENYVEVMVEKQALEGVLEPVCRQLDIRFSANKGYSSSSAMYLAGKRFARKIDDEKCCHMIYLGDHDPSGIDMTRDVEERLKLFAKIQPYDGFGDDDNEADFGTKITVHRIALNMNQIKKLRPPENPAKLTDSRANNYIEKFGRSSWELDAIEPRALSTLVRNQVLELRDDDKWNAAVARELAMRNEVLALAKKSKFK